jgi:hypothetical protein
MTRRDLDATDRILWDFISGHWIHLHLVYIYRHNQNMIGIIAVRPNVILGWESLFSPPRAPSVFFSGKIWHIETKSVPFLLLLNHGLKRCLWKEKQVEQFLIETAAYRRKALTGGWWTRRAAVCTHTDHTHPILIDVSVRLVLPPIRRAEVVVNCRSRYLILHKTWSFLSQFYSKLHDFPFSVHFNQPCDLGSANIVEIIAESDSIFISDISRSIFYVTLDYKLTNPVLSRWEHS